MNTKAVSEASFKTIAEYLHFKIGQAECSVPYFNNRRKMQRAGLRAVIGKGSPREIFDEVEILGLREKITRNSWTNELLKKFMCDQNIGIDCSGLAYYILQAENRARGFGALDRHLAFTGRSLLRRIAAKLRPAENADVLVFSNDRNSATVPLDQIQPGDFISMTGSENDRNHILVVHAVDYQNFVPTAIHYTHSIAWPEDGFYGHGVRQAIIEILDIKKGLTDQKWIENEKTGPENPTYLRATISKTEIRRLNWWM
jgi:hypothetical protein